jgi:hypothetical protein
MMKYVLLLSMILLGNINLSAQANRPEVNSIGVTYGINLNNNISHNIFVSGWLKRGIEVRGGLTFTYRGASNSTSKDSTIYNNGGTVTPQINEQSNTSPASIQLLPSIAVIAHLAQKSNADFYIGGMVSGGVNNLTTGETQNKQTITRLNYYSSSLSTYQSPPTYQIGLSFISGLNFFFYKSLALGIEGTLGFDNMIQKGDYINRYSVVNTGSSNPNQNYNSTRVSHTSQSNSNITLNGGGTLKLLYYMPVHKKQPVATPPSM